MISIAIIMSSISCSLHLIFIHLLLTDGGECGLEDDEYEAAVATLQSLAAALETDCVCLRERKMEKGMTGQFLIRKKVEEHDFLEIR